MKKKILFLLVLFGLNTAVFAENFNKSLSEKLENSPTQNLDKEDLFLQYLKNCEQNSTQDSCFLAGSYMISLAKTEVYNDYITLESECGNDNLDKCYDLAVYFLDARHFAKNEKKAKELLAKNCEKSHKPSCDALKNSIIPSILDNENVKFFYSAAYILQDMGCKNGYENSCYLKAELLDKGNGVDKDNNQATQIYDKLCQNNHLHGCAKFAIKLLNGEFVSKNKIKSKEILQNGCDKNSAESCYDFYLYFASNDNNYLNKACDLGSNKACCDIANKYFMQKRFETAFEYFKKGCDKNMPDQCFMCGESLAKLGNKNAKQYYDKACKMGVKTACEK